MLNFKSLTSMHKLLGIIFTVVYFSLCAPFAKAQQSAINRFAEVVDSLHSHIIFPYTVAQGITLMNIGVDTDNKMLVINYMLNPDMVDAVANNAVTDNGIAQLLTGYDEIFSTSMIDAGAGCKIVISSPSKNGDSTSKIVTIPLSRISPVYQKLKNGDFSSLKPYLELLQSTFSDLKFPLKIANGILLTNAYIVNKDVYWMYEIEGEIIADNISDEIIQLNRLNMINSLRSTIAPEYTKEIEEQGIKIHYVYKNNKGEELYDFVFTDEDLR